MKTVRPLAFLIFFLAVAQSGCAQTAAPIRVLFLGNSLTDGNDVPGIVQALAGLQGVTLHVDSSTPGGYNLEDHWNVGESQLLRTGDYDLVVMQQGPSTTLDSQANLKEWTRVWTDFAHTQGTEAALFMVWPFTWQANGFALVSQSYRGAAVASGIEVFPAGEVWEKAFARQRLLQLYSDDLHANQAGSLLAAMVIGRRLFALDPARVPTRLPTRFGTIVVEAGDLDLFRAVVSELAPVSMTFATPPAAPASSTVTFPTPTGTAGGGGGGGGGSPSAVGAALLALCLVARRFCSLHSGRARN